MSIKRSASSRCFNDVLTLSSSPFLSCDEDIRLMNEIRLRRSCSYSALNPRRIVALASHVLCPSRTHRHAGNFLTLSGIHDVHHRYRLSSCSLLCQQKVTVHEYIHVFILFRHRHHLSCCPITPICLQNSHNFMVTHAPSKKKKGGGEGGHHIHVSDDASWT